MSDRRQCEFFLIRYVPDAVKNEFVNIGVVMRDDTHGAEVRFTKDWQRVRCADPDADTAMLEALESEVRRRLTEADPIVPVMKTLQDSLSNAVQITNAKACLAESLPAEMERLMRLYVEQPKRTRDSRKSGRVRVYGAMRTAFERAGVWELMRKRIAAADYTRPGDLLRIDCGYRPNGVIKMFHAVSLDSDTELAKVLAFSAPKLRDGVQKVEEAKLELTAIIEPLAALKNAEDEDRIEAYRFGVETMEQSNIRVLTTNDMQRVAETARFELRV